MIAVVQRVTNASVEVDGVTVGKIGFGLLVLLGVRRDDQDRNCVQLARKILNLRIFPDTAGKMSLSLLDLRAEMLVVSQFTLYGDTRKGNRPSYSLAAPATVAKPLYEMFIATCKAQGVTVETGIFQASMQVQSVNNGPLTLLCESISK